MLQWTVQEEAQGSNSNGNSSGATSSDIVEPQPDVNPIWSNPNPVALPQPDPFNPFDPIFDLSPLPESINFLQLTPGSVNPMQDQSGLTQFIDGAPIVGSTDLGLAQYTDPNNQCKCMDMGFNTCVDMEPLFSPQPMEFDNLSDILDPFEQPSFNMFPPWEAYWWYNVPFLVLS